MKAIILAMLIGGWPNPNVNYSGVCNKEIGVQNIVNAFKQGGGEIAMKVASAMRSRGICRQMVNSVLIESVGSAYMHGTQIMVVYRVVVQGGVVWVFRINRGNMA